MNNLQKICLKNGYLLHPDAKVKDFKELFKTKIPISFNINDVENEVDEFFKGTYFDKFEDLEIILSDDIEKSKKLLFNLLNQTKGKKVFVKYLNIYKSL